MRNLFLLKKFVICICHETGTDRTLGAILLDVGQKPAKLALPLLRRQPRVDGQVLHHGEIIAHPVGQPCQQQSLF